MILDVTKLILEVGKSLFGFRAEIAKADREGRERVANYFTDIAALIEEVSAMLKINQYPHGSCAQLGTLAEQMPRTLKDLVSDEDIEKNQKKLLSVHEIERLFCELQALPPKEAAVKLGELDEAAGQFRALATHLKVII